MTAGRRNELTCAACRHAQRTDYGTICCAGVMLVMQAARELAGKGHGAPLLVRVADCMLHGLLQILPRLIEDKPAEVGKTQPPRVALQGAGTRVHDWAGLHASLCSPAAASWLRSAGATVGAARFPGIEPGLLSARQLRSEAACRHGQASVRGSCSAARARRDLV